MKKFLTTLTLVFVTASLTFAAGKYQVNDEALDNMFNAATEISYTDMAENGNMFNTDFSDNNGLASFRGGDSPILAFVLCWFLGYLGIHRLYLGTKGIVIVGYILTGGRCGIIVTVDWIMLLVATINGDASKYVDNPAFIMW